jgi:hypothetical protein
MLDGEVEGALEGTPDGISVAVLGELDVLREPGGAPEGTPDG